MIKIFQRKPKEKKEKASGSMNRQVYVVMYFFAFLFLAMMFHLFCFIQFDSSDAINNSYNPRQEKLAARVIRGGIYAADGTALATTEVKKSGAEKRVYPFGELFAHVVGASTKSRIGVESMANISLLTSNADIGEKISRELAEEKNIGDNIITTLDVDIQKTAREALGIYKGAIVVMNASTGEILAMVSNPGFDPNTIAEDWDSLNEDANSPLLNRAALGLYPPGSTFKIVTLLEYYRENSEPENYSFSCNGRFSWEGVTINCYHGSNHGKLDLRRSFAKSCNSSFANIGSSLDMKSFRRTAEDLLFNKDLPVKMSYKSGSFPCEAGCSPEERLHTAIGQGRTLISPLHMSLITSAIANDGVLRKPLLIKRIETYKGDVVKEYLPADHSRLMSADEADFLEEYMEAVVKEGTGSKLSVDTYRAVGKTGSAEYSGEEKGDSHAWFTGFATSDAKTDPLVVTVLVEGAGTGADYAVPMAKRIFDVYFR